jgi:uncharacterized membrane protein
VSVDLAVLFSSVLPPEKRIFAPKAEVRFCANIDLLWCLFLVFLIMVTSFPVAVDSIEQWKNNFSIQIHLLLVEVVFFLLYLLNPYKLIQEFASLNFWR